MHYFYIGIVIYLVLGLLGYGVFGSAGAALEPSKKPSILRRTMVILFWPLAMIGAIET